MKFAVERENGKGLIEVSNITISAKSMNSYDFYDLFEEDARVFYWSLEGWKAVWPLYFHAVQADGSELASADIYILSSADDITFDVIMENF